MTYHRCTSIKAEVTVRVRSAKYCFECWNGYLTLSRARKIPSENWSTVKLRSVEDFWHHEKYHNSYCSQRRNDSQLSEGTKLKETLPGGMPGFQRIWRKKNSCNIAISETMLWWVSKKKDSNHRLEAAVPLSWSPQICTGCCTLGVADTVGSVFAKEVPLLSEMESPKNGKATGV